MSIRNVVIVFNYLTPYDLVLIINIIITSASVFQDTSGLIKT